MSNDKKCYNVVLFTRSNTVGVCHESWMQLGEEEETFCYWPARGNPTNKAKKRKQPLRDDPSSWKMHRVRVLKQHKSWDRGLELCKDAENKTDIDTSSCEVDASKRKTKLPERYREDETVSDGVVETTKVANRAASKQQPMSAGDSGIIWLADDYRKRPFIGRQPSGHDADKRPNNAADNGNVSTGLGSAAGDSRILVSLDDNHGEVLSSVSEVADKNVNVSSLDTDSSRESDDDNFKENDYPPITHCGSIRSMNRPEVDAVSHLRSEVTRFRVESQRNYEQLRDEIRGLKRYLEEKYNGKSETVEDLLPSPCQTEEQLLKLETRLSKDKEARTRLIDALSKVGGSRISESVRWMMKKIASNGVLEKYRLTGAHEMGNFEKLHIYRCVLRAIVNAYPGNDTVNECRSVVSDILIQAKYHKGGSNFEIKKSLNPKKTVMKQNRTILSSDEED